MLKNAENHVELKDLDVDSLAFEHLQENKAPEMWQNFQSSWADQLPHQLSLPHWADPTEKKQIVPEPEEEGTGEKDIPEETEEAKLMAWK